MANLLLIDTDLIEVYKLNELHLIENKQLSKRAISNEHIYDCCISNDANFLIMATLTNELCVYELNNYCKIASIKLYDTINHLTCSSKFISLTLGYKLLSFEIIGF